MASLSLYEHGITQLATLYPNKWSHIYLSDVRVRLEQWASLYLDLMIGEHVPRSCFDARRPWDYIIRTTAHGVPAGALLMFWQTRS